MAPLSISPVDSCLRLWKEAWMKGKIRVEECNMDKTLTEKTFAVESLGEGRYRLGLTYPDFVGLIAIVSRLLASRGINIVRGSIDTIGPYGWIVLELSCTAHPDWDRLEKELFGLAEKAYTGHFEKAFAELALKAAK